MGDPARVLPQRPAVDQRLDPVIAALARLLVRDLVRAGVVPSRAAEALAAGAIRPSAATEVPRVL